MNTYMKRFIFASLMYFGIAAVLGILNGVADLGYCIYFAHTHFNLLGFMSMMVFGIGYFILPRFNGTTLRFENWVPIHFWLANISLIGMVAFRGLSVDTGENYFNILFIICAVLQVSSIAMFIVNMWMTLTPGKLSSALNDSSSQQSASFSAAINNKYESPTKPIKPVIKVSSDSVIAELIDLLPSLKKIFIESGLRSLQMPEHLEKVRKMGITIGIAAQNHSIDPDKLISSIKNELKENGFIIKEDEQSPLSNGNIEAPEITIQMLIGNVLEKYPEAKTVFQKYFGDGCFDCPGQSYESIDMACRMHGVEPDTFITELKEILIKK